MKAYLRLKDLSNITSEQPNYAIIMKEVLGYNNYWLGRKYVFAKKFKEAHSIITEARKVDIQKVVWEEDCPIAKPNNIDSISFRAMMEMQSVIGNSNGKDVTELIINTITIACYSENVEGEYDSESQSYIDFRKHVSEQPLFKMMGLYNWIDKSLTASELMWEERFLSVKVEDLDYERANGQRMAQFNVINTIKIIAQEFNVPYTEAWQVSYSIVQINSYAKASQAHVQDQMRIIKESRMETERKRNKHS